MARTPVIPLGLLLVAAASAQTPDAVNWAFGLGSRFEKLTNPVASSYALGQLAAQVCEHDKTVGAGLFRQALSSLNTLSDSLFMAQGPILPVSSLTALWKSIGPPAERCDPTLASVLDPRRTTARLTEERLHANEKLDLALKTIQDLSNYCYLPQRPPSAFARPTGANLYRCMDFPAQLADNAITSGDPDTLEIGDFTSVLSLIRDRVPELTDDLFSKSLDLALSPGPRMPLLDALGGYLFTSGAISRTTNPYSVSAYIDAALKAADVPESPYYNAVSAYKVIYQSLAAARELDLDSVPRLEQALAKIQVRPNAAQQIQAMKDDSLFRRDRLIDLVLSEGRQKHFDAARNLLPDLDDAVSRDQLRPLIAYTETLDAIDAKDFDRAFQLASSLKPGVKRALLYASIMATAPPDVATQMTSMVSVDAASLTAEHRIAVLSAASAALMRTDPERALTLVNEIVKAMNDAGVQPHLAIFDTRKERTSTNSGNAASTDVPQILLRDVRLDEVVDSGRRWHMVELRVTGPTAFSLPGVLRNAGKLDPARLEAAVLGIKDETRRASALNALAELRLNPR